MKNLRQALFAPESIAIVGQSNDPAKNAGRPLKYLRQAGYAGRIYPINPARESVLGERAWPSLAALPEIPQHAYIVTSADVAIAAAEECGRRGVAVATLLADGFTESGEQGAARTERLRDIRAKTGIRIVGPSSLGVADLRSKALITANAAFDERALPEGRIFAASHSGSMIGALLSRGKARGIAFAGFVSVGNEIDLSLGEICELMLDDESIDGYMLFLETMRHARALRRFAQGAWVRGKPVIAYKLGRSAPARELAVSHTGALAGEDDVADAFLSACGIARVETLEALIEGFSLLGRVPVETDSARRATVGVVTTTGGGATCVVDPLAVRGIAIESPSPETLARLAAAGIHVKPARLVDLTLAGTRYDTMKAALKVLTTAPEFDLVLCVVGSSARFHPDLAVQPIVECAGAAKPLAAFLTPDAPAALAALTHTGIPNFRTPEACADAIAAALRRRAPKLEPARNAPVVMTGSSLRMLDELRAFQLVEHLGIACAPLVTIDVRSTKLPELPFSYPVAVKAMLPGTAHKTDIGAVVLGVAGPQALAAAMKEIRKNISERRPTLGVDHFLVQPMASGLGEILLGYRVDPSVGPLVMVAAGGILTEIHRDRSIRLGPVDVGTAREMISEVRSLVPLSGYRGRPQGDIGALADAIAKLSRLADDEKVLEAEINPLIVREQGKGVVAVDALVRIASDD
jgi:acyl-CoA synthetase (NDP forming)